MRYFTLASRVIIGAIFIYASYHKILDPAAFAVDVRNYAILPPAWSHIVALTLPWIELAAGAFLVLGIQTKPSALLTTVMLAVFTAAVTYAYAIGLDISCGCFKSAPSAAGRTDVLHIALDVVLLLISGFVLVTDKGELSVTG